MSGVKAGSASRVPNEPLRRAYEASGLTPTEVCRRLGWTRSRGSGAETSSLVRRLGIARSLTSKKGVSYVSHTSTLDRREAEQICEAIGVDFDEVYDGWLDPQLPRGGTCVTCGERLLRSDPYRMCGFCHFEIAEFGEPMPGMAA